MQRYFVDNSIVDNKVTINQDDSHHIKNVMRMSKGDIIEIVKDNRLYLGRIISLDSLVDVEIIEEKEEYSELSIKVTIAQSLVVEAKMDLILQKTTELGVNEIIPLMVERSKVNYSSKEDKKLIRWKRIVKEASEQSKRLSIPSISKITTINELINMNYDVKVLCSVNEVSTSIKKVLDSVDRCATILIVVGPEGGLSKDEEEILINNGFISTSFGKRVLRSETSSIYLLSIINYILME